MTDDSTDAETHETPDDVAARPVTSFGPHSRHTIADIRFAMIEGYRPLRLDIHLPPQESARPFPAVLSIHGGGWVIGSNKIDSDDVAGIADLWQALLDRGIAVVAVQYRFSREAPFPAALHDVKSAVRWIRKHGDRFGIDPTRIGAFGDSAGGHLAALLAARTPSELEGSVGVVDGSSDVRAAVAWYPVTELESLSSLTYDWADAESMSSLLVGGEISGRTPEARMASPITHIHAGSSPILLLHGDQDDLVPFAQSLALASRYRDVGGDVEIEILPGAEHGYGGDDLSRAIDRSVDFFSRHFEHADRDQR